MLAQSGHLLEVVTVLTPSTVAGYLLVMWGQAPTTGLIAWTAIVLIASLVVGVSAFSMRSGGIPDTPPWHLVGAMMLAAATWGSLPLIAMPASVEWKPVTGVLIIGPIAANIIFSASVPRLFWTFNLSLIGTAVTGFVVSGRPTDLAVVAILAYIVPFSAVLSLINQRSNERAAFYAITAEQTNDELSLSNKLLAIEVSRDSLTGLANRGEFGRQLDEAILTSAQVGLTVGVLFIDIDRFKVINDSLGHQAGDDLLHEVAKRISNELRDGDMLARLGGDEFTVLVRNVVGVEDVEGVARRVIKAFDEPFTIGGRRHPITASIGVACAGAHARTVADLLRRADAALYQAKDDGRARIAVFDENLRERLDRRLDDETELRRALERGEITGWFQPIVELETGRITSAEGLARWKTPDGLRSAAGFIDLAIDAGLDIELSKAVIVDMLELKRAIHERGVDIGLGCNLPPARLFDLLDVLSNVPDLTGIALEITETGIITDLDRARRHLDEMRRRGASIWLDDFGQGQSSLSLLTSLPLDGVKIDRQFVKGMLTDSTSHAIVQAVSDLGRNLGLTIIAEGVESIAQAQRLRELGVSLGQGFLFSPAVPPADFLALEEIEFSYADRLGVRRPARLL